MNKGVMSSMTQSLQKHILIEVFGLGVSLCYCLIVEMMAIQSAACKIDFDSTINLTNSCM